MVPQKASECSIFTSVNSTSVYLSRLVVSHLKDITDPLLNPLQFAYRANRSADDAINVGLHHILKHLDTAGMYARILFVDFSSAFNTIVPDTKPTPSSPSLLCPPPSVNGLQTY